MSDGHSGGQGGDGSWGYGTTDPYSSSDPYASSDPYSSSDPYGTSDPYGSSGADPSGSGSASDPYGTYDPYATTSSAAGAEDQLASPGFGPEFGGSPVAAPAYATPAYGAPASSMAGYGVPAYAVAPPTAGSAIAALVLGILSLTMCQGIAGPVGLVFSIIAMRQTAPGTVPVQGGRGLAIAGLVTSILGTLVLAFWIVYIVIMVVFVATVPTDY